jgi:hypothetical protein
MLARIALNQRRFWIGSKILSAAPSSTLRSFTVANFAVRAVVPSEAMPRFSLTFVCCVVSSAGASLGACAGDAGPSSSSSSSAGAATSGASGSAATAGAPGSAGANSFAAGSGTGPGGSSAGASTTAGAAGTPGTAGAAGSGQSGAGGGSGKCGTALFCDDFESYTGTPAAPWTVQKDKDGSGGVTIDGTQHKSGTQSVKFTLSGATAYQQALISVAQPFPIAGNAFYGRMMIYTSAAPNDGVHWTMLQGEGPAPAHDIQRALVRYGGQHQQRFMANYETGQGDPGSDCWKHSQTKMPEKAWSCMEWYFDGATNTQKFWLDNTPIEDLTVTGTGEGCVTNGTGGNWYFPNFEKLSVGWESYQTDAAREVWIDDVAIGTTQIGCPL